VEPEQSRSQGASATSRRDLHRARVEPRRAPTSRMLRWAPRGTVLGALAAATIVFPLVDASAPDVVAQEVAVEAVRTVAPEGAPTAYEVLASAVQESTPTSLLAAVPGTREVAETVSRTIDRDPLPGCGGEARPGGSNGQIPASDLCRLWDPAHMLRGDAAVAISELNLNYRAAFGRDLCMTDTYRPLSVQRRLAVVKPGLAATPGRSNHGWGLAVDLCSTEIDNPTVLAWLRENGPTYGWDNPEWARRGGSGPYEPWHWEYVPGTTSLGTSWDN
jgi:zinc D-Ala-D-Ala carboxypeptidase